MITKRRSMLLALTAVLALVLSTASVNAESTVIRRTCSFNGSKIVSNFSSDEFARIVSDLQPGDDVTFEVTYTNNHSESTDWYMENTIEQTLEKTTAAKKTTAKKTATKKSTTKKTAAKKSADKE